MKNALKFVPCLLIACSEPRVEEPPPVLEQCKSFCEKIEDECGYGPPGSAFEGVEPWENCPRDCSDAYPDDEPCQEAGLALKACTAALTCEELTWEFVEGKPPPPEQDGCLTERRGVHLCNLEHHSPEGAED